MHLLEPAPQTQTATAHLQATCTVYFDGQGWGWGGGGGGGGGGGYKLAHGLLALVVKTSHFTATRWAEKMSAV